MLLKCTKCGLEKEEVEFRFCGISKYPRRGGYACSCIECEKQYMKYYYERNAEKCKKAAKDSKARRSEQTKDYHKQYAAKNKDKIAVYKKEWQTNNKEIITAKRREYYKNNPEKRQERLDYMNNWYHKNKQEPKFIENRRNYDKIYSERVDVNLIHRIRRRFKGWLDADNVEKRTSVTKLVGMERSDFVNYIESQFTEGMVWENIHIDHYVPLNHFDPSDEYEQRIAWNWRNLRPLFIEDNLSKGSKLPEDYLEVIEEIKKNLAVS